MLRQHEPESPPTAVADPVGERLLRARTIIISGEISQKLAATVSAQLLALAAESEADIMVFINSQGGHVQTGQPLERIEEDTHRNFWLGAEAALRYGLVGRIIEHASDLDG